MSGQRARRGATLFLAAFFFLLSVFSLGVARPFDAWAETGSCGYAYLEPNADDPALRTLVIRKTQRADSGSYQELGPVPASATKPEDLPWHDPQERREKIAAVVVDGSAGAVAPASTSCWFYQCWNARSFDLSGLDSSNVTDMSQMFLACETVRSLDLSGLDTSNVTSMANMFSICSSLRLLDLSGFDTSKVTTMAGMVQVCTSLETVDLSGLNTSNVASMRAMFGNCFALSSVDVTGVDTSHVKDMGEMFRGCSSLTELDLSALDASAVEDAAYMFAGCSSLASVDLSSFDFLRIRSFERMFSECVALGSVDLSNCGTVSAGWHNADEMFRGCRSLTSVSLPRAGELALSSAKDMFKGCYSLESLDFSNVALPASPSEIQSGAFVASGLREVAIGPNLANAGVLEGLFSVSSAWAVKGDAARTFYSADEVLAAAETAGGATTFVAAGDPVGIFAYEETATHTLVLCPQRKELSSGERAFGSVVGDVVPWADDARSIARVRIEEGVAPASTAKWFYGCDELKEIEGMGNLDTSEVTDMSSMFCNCTSLSSLDVSGLDTSSVADFSFMFHNCRGLSNLDVSKFDTARATTLRGMFEGCSSLAELDVRGFDTSRANYLDGMFGGCSSLAELDVSAFKTNAALGASGMFSGCSSLAGLDVSGFDTAVMADMRHLFSGCESLESLRLFELDDSRSRELGSMFSGCSSLRELDLSGFKLAGTTVWNTPITWGLEDFFSGCTALDRVTLSAAAVVVPEFPEGMWAADGAGAAYRHDAMPGGRDATYAKVADKPYYHALLSADGALSIGAQPVEASAGEQLYQLLDEGYASAADVPWNGRAGDIVSVAVGAGVHPASVAHWFEGCTALEALDLSGLDTSGTGDFSGMFRGCSSLAALDLSGFDTKAATSMRRMFHGCRALESVTFGDAFTFRGSAWSRLPGSELPSGAWQRVGADGVAVDVGYAYASDSIPGLKEASYRKIDDAQPGLTIESIRGDTETGSAKYTVKTQLVKADGEDGAVEAVSDYILDENYASAEFAIGDGAKASSVKTVSRKTVYGETVNSVVAKGVTSIKIGPQVAKIKAKAFAGAPKVASITVCSDKLTTRGSVYNCLFKSKVKAVHYDLTTTYAKYLKVKGAFRKWSGKKFK